MPSPPSICGIIHIRKSSLQESQVWVTMVEPSAVASLPIPRMVHAIALDIIMTRAIARARALTSFFMLGLSPFPFGVVGGNRVSFTARARPCARSRTRQKNSGSVSESSCYSAATSTGLSGAALSTSLHHWGYLASFMSTRSNMYLAYSLSPISSHSAYHSSALLLA